ncbi:unnamed protein product [Parnassius apollo]|uniref:(apollo) hypothetical protein n=1 Tax=Parnassius apollo TaxID=110799 RepID=A0A8S3YDP7_PARAO|nr:unnamed protein product [Parnassius apollo]
MSNSEDKSSNGVGSDPLKRLASFKAPRDLSLGGVKPNKKIFVPNLNVARNKNKGSSSANVREQKKEDKGRKDKRNDRNRNFKNGPNIIKSSGVFSEGLGSAERHYNRGPSYGRETDAKPTLQKPTIRVKDVIKIDKELEEQKIKNVVGDSGDGEEESEDFKHVFETDAPVKLPMDDGAWLNSHSTGTVKIKQEVVVKREPTEDGDCPMPDVEEKPMPSDFEDTNVVNLLKSDKPTLILLQLPDSLPGRGGRAAQDAPRKQTPPSSHSAPEQDPEPVDTKCRLADLEEGRIGKLQVRRSGRVTLTLGDTVFEVCPGTKAAFHQEAVSVAVEHSSRSANLVSLGPLQHKLNIVPDWQALFTDMAV